MADGTVSTIIEAHAHGGEVATVTVDRPARLNALSQSQCVRLRDALLELHGRDDLRAVVLTGAGERAFIGGADINELATLDETSGRAFITAIHEVCDAIRQCPVPVIARVNGYCLGAGMEVAAACDLRIGCERAVYGMPEVRIGLPSVIEAALLPSLIGWGRTRWLVLTAQNIDAATAHGWGFTESCVADDALDEATDAALSAIAASAPVAVRDQKILIAKWERLDVDAAIQAGIDAFANTCKGDEHKRYIADFHAARARG